MAPTCISRSTMEEVVSDAGQGHLKVDRDGCRRERHNCLAMSRTVARGAGGPRSFEGMSGREQDRSACGASLRSARDPDQERDERDLGLLSGLGHHIRL
jgi:hypothetical protein